MADLNCRIELSGVQTLVCLCRTFAGVILFWLKTLARRYAIAAVRREILQSIILFEFLVGNTSLGEGFLCFSLFPFYLLFISAVYGGY